VVKVVETKKDLLKDLKDRIMGKLFVKIGLWMQKVWCKFQCNWNWLVSKLLFNVASCPNKLCTCKKYTNKNEI